MSLLDPDIEWLEPEEAPDRAVVRGREEALGALSNWLGTWSSYEMAVTDVIDAGEGGVIVCMVQRTGAAGGAMELEGELFQHWSLRDGIPVRAELFLRREQALAAAGLS